MRAEVADPQPQRLHPLTPLADVLGNLRNYALVLFGALAARRTGALFAVVPVTISTALRVAAWRRFSYSFGPGVLRVESGVFSRRRREVPVDRVQQVELVRRFRHRLLGLAALRVDTGGGSAAEISLDALSRREANRLRDAIESGRGGLSVPGRTTGDAAPHLVKLTPGQLAVAGATGAQVGVMAAIAFWFYDFIREIPGVGTVVLEALPRGRSAVLVGVVALAPAWIALAAIASMLTHGGFTMRVTGRELRVERGVFDRREAVMDLERLAFVRVDSSIVRRMLGLCSIRLMTGSPRDSSGVSQISIPVLRAGEVERVLSVLLAEPVALGELEPHPREARVLAVARRAIPVAAIATAVSVLWWPGGAVSTLAVPIAAVTGVVAFRALGHASRGGLVLARSGGLARRTSVVRTSRVQSGRLSSSPLQRVCGVADLALDVPGRSRAPTIRDAHIGVVRGLISSAIAPAADDERSRRAAGRATRVL